PSLRRGRPARSQRVGVMADQPGLVEKLRQADEAQWRRRRLEPGHVFSPDAIEAFASDDITPLFESDPAPERTFGPRLAELDDKGGGGRVQNGPNAYPLADLCRQWGMELTADSLRGLRERICQEWEARPDGVDSLSPAWAARALSDLGDYAPRCSLGVLI